MYVGGGLCTYTVLERREADLRGVPWCLHTLCLPWPLVKSRCVQTKVCHGLWQHCTRHPIICVLYAEGACGMGLGVRVFVQHVARCAGVRASSYILCVPTPCFIFCVSCASCHGASGLVMEHLGLSFLQPTTHTVHGQQWLTSMHGCQVRAMTGGGSNWLFVVGTAHAEVEHAFIRSEYNGGQRLQATGTSRVDSTTACCVNASMAQWRDKHATYTGQAAMAGCAQACVPQPQQNALVRSLMTSDHALLALQHPASVLCFIWECVWLCSR